MVDGAVPPVPATGALFSVMVLPLTDATVVFAGRADEKPVGMVTVHPTWTVLGTGAVSVMVEVPWRCHPRRRTASASHDPLGLVNPLAVTCAVEAESSAVASVRREKP